MVKGEHYIPRFYLEKFSDNGKICAYDFKTKKIINTNVSKIGKKNYFYDIDPKELKKELLIIKDIANISDDIFENNLDDIQFIENALSRIETKASIYFNKFEKDYNLIQDENFLSILFIFVYTLSVRTISFRDDLENISSQTTKWLKSLDITKVENYPLDKQPNEIAKLNQLNELISLPRMYKKSISFFENYELFVAVNETKLDFIISDNPLLYFFLGFNDICFPINPKLAIIMQVKEAKKEFKICNFEKIDNQIVYLKEKEVMKYNILQYNTKAKYLFGSKEMLKYQLGLVSCLNKIKKSI